MSEDLEDKLFQFHGTEDYYPHFLGLVYTDGIKFLAEEAQCYWLIDIVASYQPKLKQVPFQLWELKVEKDNSAVVTVREDSGKPALISQEIPYTDFPLEKIKLYYCDNVLMLPGEY
ncbi:hypothetical protein MYX82_13855 [Acidobacteria bacterium AH-259-D05]|nr:hypothetical protein [Acidobacteria bacterium AH-259-D05]